MSITREAVAAAAGATGLSQDQIVGLFTRMGTMRAGTIDFNLQEDNKLDIRVTENAPMMKKAPSRYTDDPLPTGSSGRCGAYGHAKRNKEIQL